MTLVGVPFRIAWLLCDRYLLWLRVDAADVADERLDARHDQDNEAAPRICLTQQANAPVS
jgi:hypothetical protein